MDCLFCQIAQQEIPADIVYEDDIVMVFKDINPKARVHHLIIPKKHIANFSQLSATDAQVLVKIMYTAKRIAREEGIDQSGYRLIFNVNDDGGQEVQHLHLHLIGGQKLGRMA